MALHTVLDIGFAAGLVVAALTLAGTVLRRLPVAPLVGLTTLESAGAVGAWVAFALEHGRPLAVDAGGLTACALLVGACILLRRSFLRLSAVDTNLAEAEARLFHLVEREAAERAGELERTLARARADSASLLEQQERSFAEERRKAFAERERDAVASLSEKLTQTQSQVEQRLAGWAQDLDRAAEATKARIAELRTRQEQLLS